MKQTSVLLPIILSAVVIAAYALHAPYYAVLFALPIILILLKRFSFDDLDYGLNFEEFSTKL